MGLKMKYFVLKPVGDTLHAEASRQAMLTYAMIIKEEDVDLARDLEQWVTRSTMKNLRMKEKLEKGECIDLSNHPRNNEGYYLLKETEVIKGMDYCNAKTEEWIWSIGKHRVTGKIFASRSPIFHQNIHYECLWLR